MRLLKLRVFLTRNISGIYDHRGSGQWFSTHFSLTPNLDCNRVILEFNGIFGHEFVPYDRPWVVLNRKSRIFFQRLVHACRQRLNLM